MSSGRRAGKVPNAWDRIQAERHPDARDLILAGVSRPRPDLPRPSSHGGGGPTRQGRETGNAVSYAIWAALGLSILVQFALVLLLQRQGVIEISDRGGALDARTHVILATGLLLAAAAGVAVLRSRRNDPDRLLGAARRGVGRPEPGAAPGGRGRPGEIAPAAPTPDQAVLGRYLALSVLAWALAEALAVAGFVLALALPPVPRLALTVYFTGGLLLWLWSRPDPAALAEARRRASAGA